MPAKKSVKQPIVEHSDSECSNEEWEKKSESSDEMPNNGRALQQVVQQPQQVNNTRGRGRGGYQQYSSGYQQQHRNSVLNFDYNQYRTIDKPVNELDDKELLKILIARTFNAGQTRLCDVLRQTLRGICLETELPTIIQRTYEKYEKKPYVKHE